MADAKDRQDKETERQNAEIKCFKEFEDRRNVSSQHGTLLPWLVNAHRKGQPRNAGDIYFEYCRKHKPDKFGADGWQDGRDAQNAAKGAFRALDDELARFYQGILESKEPVAQGRLRISLDHLSGSAFRPIFEDLQVWINRQAPRLEIPTDNATARDVGLLRFWQPHLRNRGIPTHIAYGLPLFVKKGKSTYLRRIDINDPEKLHKNRGAGLVRWTYVTDGDVQCTYRIFGWLLSQGAAVTFNGYTYKSDLGELEKGAGSANASVIAVGSARVNGTIREYQKTPRDVKAKYWSHFPYSLHDKLDVVEIDASGNRVTAHRNRTDTDPDIEHVPVLLTRRKNGAVTKDAVTIIASNNGRGVQRVGMLFTDANDLDNFLRDKEQARQHAALRGWTTKIPDEFQILFYVTVRDSGRVPGQCRVHRVWLPPPK